MRADRAVEPTRSENITVTWRRSARSSGAALGGADVVASVGSAEFLLECRAPMAFNILRRAPSGKPSSRR